MLLNQLQLFQCPPPAFQLQWQLASTYDFWFQIKSSAFLVVPICAQLQASIFHDLLLFSQHQLGVVRCLSSYHRHLGLAFKVLQTVFKLV